MTTELYLAVGVALAATLLLVALQVRRARHHDARPTTGTGTVVSWLPDGGPDGGTPDLSVFRREFDPWGEGR